MGKEVSAACLCVTSGGPRRDEIHRTPQQRSEGWEEYRHASSGGFRQTTAMMGTGRCQRTDARQWRSRRRDVADGWANYIGLKLKFLFYFIS